MSDDFLDYFERELSFLRETGSDFARKYPKIAGRLLLEPGKCEDPHTERLIEAFAFLCARIQRKIDDGVPEITQSLLQVLYPQLTAPIPSLSVVKFAPLFRNVPEAGYQVPKGTPLFSKPVDGVSCQFRTTYPVTLCPLEVIDASLQAPVKLVKGAQQVVRVRLLLHSASFAGDRLRFYLNGQPQHVFPLYQLLLNHLCSVEYVPPGASAADSLQLPSACLRPVGFASDEGLLPYPEQSFPGYRLLLEYFAFPHKFLFLDLTGTSALWKCAASGDAVDLLFYLDTHAPESVVVGPETFCLYATPVVNSFQKIAEPIRHNHGKSEYRIVPDVRGEGAFEVLSVDEVMTYEATSLRELKCYRPVFSGDGVEDSAGVWQSQRRPASRLHDAGTEVFLSLCEPVDAATVPMEETVLVRVTSSNRDLPVRIPFGDSNGDFETESTAPITSINCLLKPTPSLRPFLDGSQQRRLISHLSLNYISIVEGGAAALKQLLSLYDFASSSITRHQISGIVSVSSRTVTRRIGSAFCRGLEVTVVFNEDKYVGSGVYLFASILERFLGQYVSINSFVQLVAVSASNDAVIKRWPARTGDKVLL
ncbi:type VI secretion system baseplate subunit TssF [Geomonas agri]|uniref:type VI secretion system baseplate subunit TssF n=1 Tax=Geomonas agri TaxID=2873702 RepID=UPI001CD6B0FE|nr:type VI secretion system baseplate subunit TssF [Geomonas agri]